MAHGCRLVQGDRAAQAAWRRDGDTLLISPSGAPPLTIALEQVGGIAGDGFTVQLRLPDGEVALERLGGDGPTLLQELRRDWPVLRAAVLRLDGGERPNQVYAGAIEASGARGPFRGFLVDGRLLVAPEGGDLFALFLADFSAVDLDEDAAAVRLTPWSGGEPTVLRKLGGETTGFARALQAAREVLAREAAAVVDAHLPTLAAGPRAALATEWLPGRLLSFEQLERLAPGFEAGFRQSWLAGLPRAASGAELMTGVAPGARYLGYAAPTAEGQEPDLWLLVQRGDSASLEFLSHGDYATYQFRAGPELPALVEGLVRLPEFSREALYQPLAELTGERAIYAVPARDLPVLRGLRERFTGRKIHAAEG